MDNSGPNYFHFCLELSGQFSDFILFEGPWPFASSDLGPRGGTQ